MECSSSIIVFFKLVVSICSLSLFKVTAQFNIFKMSIKASRSDMFGTLSSFDMPLARIDAGIKATALFLAPHIEI